MENFLSLKLEETLIESLAKINFKTPTPIQAQAIPVAKISLVPLKQELEKRGLLEFR
jgi:hypothetical protein